VEKCLVSWPWMGTIPAPPNRLQIIDIYWT
jgi:hypothetical protein